MLVTWTHRWSVDWSQTHCCEAVILIMSECKHIFVYNLTAQADNDYIWHWVRILKVPDTACIVSSMINQRWSSNIVFVLKNACQEWHPDSSTKDSLENVRQHTNTHSVCSSRMKNTGHNVATEQCQTAKNHRTPYLRWPDQCVDPCSVSSHTTPSW